MKVYQGLLAIWLAAAIAGCGSAQSTALPADSTQVSASARPKSANPSGNPPAKIQEYRPEPAGTPEFGITSTPNPNMAEVILAAKTNLATQLKIEIGQITLLKAMEIVWPDTSLGCPESGVDHAQVLTPGFLIQLEAGGKAYEYHADTDNTLYMCGNGLDNLFPDIPITPGEIQDGIPWVPVN